MTVKLQYPFRGILERSWRSLPLWSVFSYCFMKPLCSRASQPFMKWWSVNSESLQLPQQHTVHFHWPWANPVCGLKQIIPIMVVLRGRISLPIPSKAQNMLGTGWEQYLLWCCGKSECHTATASHQGLPPESK